MKWGIDNSILYLLCKVKQKPFKCPDGTIRFLYKNPDDFVKDVVNQWAVGLKISPRETGSMEFEPNVEMNPKEIRKNVDEIVEQTRLHMKALYESYSINPCNEKNYQRFQNSILKVIEIGSIIRTLKETLKQAPSLDTRYEELKRLANSDLKNSETVKMAQRATRYSKSEYHHSLPLEIKGLLDMLNKKCSELFGTKDADKSEEKKIIKKE